MPRTRSPLRGDAAAAWIALASGDGRRHSVVNGRITTRTTAA